MVVTERYNSIAARTYSPVYSGLCGQMVVLNQCSLTQVSILTPCAFLYLSHLVPFSDHRSIVGCVAVASKKGGLFVLDRIRSNQLPNLNTAYTSERADRAKSYPEGTFPSDGFSPPENINFGARVETDSKQVRTYVHGVHLLYIECT